jgi:glycosyltransferase involved in cell wall biosynthesis
MMDKPLVSILVNCYNSEAYLNQALDSIYAQTYQNFEIILVDNCSTDRTAEISLQYDQRLKYVKTAQLMPLYSARNVGLKLVTGSYLAFLDSDDCWNENKLERQVQIIEETSADFVYSSYRNIIEVSNQVEKFLFLSYLRILTFSHTKLTSGFVRRSKLIKKYNINLQTVILKTNLIRELQFDDSLNLMGDLDFFFRLFWLREPKIYFDSKVTAISRVHANQLSRKSSSSWVRESEVAMSKYNVLFNEDELAAFNWYFVRFYQSQVLIDQGRTMEGIMIKKDYIFHGISYALHFLRTIGSILKK